MTNFFNLFDLARLGTGITVVTWMSTHTVDEWITELVVFIETAGVAVQSIRYTVIDSAMSSVLNVLFNLFV